MGDRHETLLYIYTGIHDGCHQYLVHIPIYFFVCLLASQVSQLLIVDSSLDFFFCIDFLKHFLCFFTLLRFPVCCLRKIMFCLASFVLIKRNMKKKSIYKYREKMSSYHASWSILIIMQRTLLLRF